MIPQEIIRKKRDNQDLSKEDINFFVDGLTNGSFSDAQIAAMRDTNALYGNGNTGSGATYGADTWHNIMSVTTSVPASTSSNFIIQWMINYGSDDWGAWSRCFNTTTNTAIGVNTDSSMDNRVATTSGGQNESGGNAGARMINMIGLVRQQGCTLEAQTFKVQLYSGRDTIVLNRHTQNNNDDITGNRGICSMLVQEIAG